MLEVILFDRGLRVGTVDIEVDNIEVGQILDNDLKVVGIRSFDKENQTAEIDIEYIV